MKTSAAGKVALTKREGERLKAYKDTVGVWTIGVGHTSMAGPPTVKPGMTISRKESQEIFARDLVKFEDAVNRYVTVPLTQSMFDALVSFVYNVGAGAFASSTLRARLNKGDYVGAHAQFERWHKPPEIEGRRDEEAAQFMKDGLPKVAQPHPIFSQPSAPSDHVPISTHPKLTPEQIMQFQEMLDQVGYHEVGQIDGKLGSASIMAMQLFQRDFNLPVTDYPTAETLARLSVTPAGARAAKLSPERRNADEAQVEEDAPGVIGGVQANKTVAQWQVWTGWAMGLMASIGQALGGDWFKDVLGLPPETIGIIVTGAVVMVAIGSLAWVMNNRASANIVTAYQQRKIV